MFETLIPQYLNELVEGKERETDTPFFKEIARLKFRRPQFSASFVFRATCPRNIKKPFKPTVKIDNHSVKGIARYPSPVLVCAFEHIRQMWLQTETSCILAEPAVIAVLKFEKVIVDITQVVKHIAKTHILRVFTHLIFIRATMLFFLSLFHGYSRITSLTPEQ